MVALVEVWCSSWLKLSLFLISSHAISDFESHAVGEPGKLDFRIFFKTAGGEGISPWHDIPLSPTRELDEDSEFHFICEIPKGTSAKMEIQKEEEHNPIAQDTKVDKKTGEKKLRFYKYPPEKPASLVNYGAFPQTYEDPRVLDPITGELGDGDPLDVIELDPAPCSHQGEVRKVRVLGALALLDGGETDWKIIVRSSTDVEPADETLIAQKVPAARDWFRMYKTAEGKGENEFFREGSVFSKAEAIEIIKHAHHHWQKLREAASPKQDL